MTAELVHPALIMVYNHEQARGHYMHYEYTGDGYAYYCCEDCGHPEDVYTGQEDDYF